MNTALFQSFYGFAKEGSFISYTVIAAGTYLPYVLAGGLLIYIFFYRKRSFPLTKRLFIIASAFLSSILAYMGVLLVRSMAGGGQRPFTSLPDIKPLIDTGQAFQSFPSLHAAIFFAVAVFLYFYHKRLGIIYIIGAFLVSIARVMAGVHWPIDIAIGAMAGALGAFVVRWFTLSVKKNL